MIHGSSTILIIIIAIQLHAYRDRQLRPDRGPRDRYWGAQTERSRQNFRSSRPDADGDRSHARHRQNLLPPKPIAELGLLAQRRARAIVRARGEVIDGKLDDHFPLVVWADRLRHTNQYETSMR